MTIEDNPEWHYKEVNPDKDCVELKVGKQMDYTTAIKTCLRLNPKWMMLSESRSTEILKLIEGFSTGVKGITTLHTDDVRKIPDRMVNMGGQARNEGRMTNDIYSFIDLGVLIRRKEMEDEDGSRHVRRYIDQICFFERVRQENFCHMIVEDGELVSDILPKGLELKLEYAGLPDPLEEMGLAGLVDSGMKLSLRQEVHTADMISVTPARTTGTYRGIAKVFT